LWLYYPATSGFTDTGLKMAPGTSPSVAPGTDDFAVAFQGSNEAYAKLSLKKYRPIAARNEDAKVSIGLL
jgi:hypothetical protein